MRIEPNRVPTPRARIHWPATAFVLALAAHAAPGWCQQDAAPGDATKAPTGSTAATGASPLTAAGGDRWYLQTSVYTHHFHVDPRHNDHQKLVDIEYLRADNYLAGISWFSNSFGQPSQYFYVGKQWRPFDSQPPIYLKLTGGLIHGYKGEFRDKIPFNHSGVAPGLIPSIGYSTKYFATELVIFGTAGIMLTFGVFLN